MAESTPRMIMRSEKQAWTKARDDKYDAPANAIALLRTELKREDLNLSILQGLHDTATTHQRELEHRQADLIQCTDEAERSGVINIYNKMIVKNGFIEAKVKKHSVERQLRLRMNYGVDEKITLLTENQTLILRTDSNRTDIDWVSGRFDLDTKNSLFIGGSDNPKYPSMKGCLTQLSVSITEAQVMYGGKIDFTQPGLGLKMFGTSCPEQC
ncbi:uncharacterized protein LOC131890979 isoform X3 [Tigriopus californicus]|uniref:uncharacterized protein LOC131890979 isoform X3 n=1 Tax=Tigriopus californicus TaxID=6832 RepID=UPI0027DAA39F|nr:uncharacterized protein LOC131890979 isoform X3 [Tigriopus californicus]